MFKDRKQAGKLLAKKLTRYKNKEDVIVFGITRGGVVVAKEISNLLKLSLDVIVIKKIGAPQNPELAIGAIGPGGVVFWDEGLINRLNLDGEFKNHSKKVKGLERRDLEKYLRKRSFGKLRTSKPLNPKNKKIILVDDGVATGATVIAAVKYFRQKKSKEVILAVPVIAKDTFLNIKRYFDTVIALRIESDLHAIGQFYREFHQVENKEVMDLINGKSRK